LLQPALGCLGRLRESVLILRLERAEDEFGQQCQIADINFVESERPRGESFKHSDDAAASA
jgi:hypothetical protein